jgi:hypothetical protein
MYPDRWTRQEFPIPAVRGIALALGVLMLALTLAAAGWRARQDAAGEVQFLGALVIVMLLSSPICHQHYFCLALPLVMGLIQQSGLCEWSGGWGMRAWRSLVGVFLFDVVVNTLPIFPPLEVLRDVCSSLYGNLAVWGVGVGTLWATSRRRGRNDVEGHLAKPLAA